MQRFRHHSLAFPVRIYRLLCTLVLLFTTGVFSAFAQNQQPNQQNNNVKDSTQFKKSNTADWKDESYRISYKHLNSDKEYIPDTGIHAFHRRLVNLPYRDLGNSGTPVKNLLFTAEDRMGPTLGYHSFDAYRFDADSVYYYSANRPYTAFGYQLGAKQEQLASLLHSQNIKPNWNFAVGYRKINSPGYYNIQRANHDNAFLSTHYQSKKLHYELYGAWVYNNELQDENGGIINDTFLTNPIYNDRRTIKVGFQNDAYGNVGNFRRSSVTNKLRDYSFTIQHGYTWGRIDTVYNSDSMHYHLEITPRFSITHRAEMSGERHLFKDVVPDSSRYAAFFQHKFGSKDSVYSRQDWFFIDNRICLNGFLGKRENLLHFSAGLGNRADVFSTFQLSDLPTYKNTSNYFIASLKKEALVTGSWFYEANAQTYLTGDYAGNTTLNIVVGKEIGHDLGRISAGANQYINSAPYSYTTYYNQFDTILASINKESITQVHFNWLNEKWKLFIGFRNYFIGNYIYLDAAQLPNQYAPTINISQVWLRKAFAWKIMVLDNEITYQTHSQAPVNIPELLGRHQLAIETRLFKKALSIATGFELRYHTSYSPDGYSPIFNRYYYQNTYYLINQPEESFFFNFKVKRFRCYLMLDQLQQVFTRNSIYAPGYPAQNLMFRFGFNWAMIN